MKSEDANKNEDESDFQNPKRARLFSAKEFQRKLLNSEDRASALKEFLVLCKETNNQDYIYEFLQSGGSCSQLLQILEQDQSVHLNIVLEILYYAILRVSANYPQYKSATYEACQHLLNNYMTLINKTLGLTTTTRDRKIVLKLLTALVTFSSSLAKDILVHVNFNPGTLEIFIKHTDDKVDNVRSAFINFLMSFLVDSHYPTICTLLEKKGLLSSIVNGLLYDPDDVVTLVLTTMKNHILENPMVSKTAKMKLFSTFVIRDFVNLYNWKGPKGVKSKKREDKVTVDEIEKSKVNQSLHEFLTVLCTSHKFGVIFKDRMVGLGKKHQNALMITVLNGLERPWDHSYANELVVKICGACPDLTRIVWSSVQNYIEPRTTKHWLNAIIFTQKLLTELEPSCIDHCVNDLTSHQFAQVVQCLAAPTAILKIIVPENFAKLTPLLKFNILIVIKQMLLSIELYLHAASKHFSSEKMNQSRNLICDHILRNYPNFQKIFSEWQRVEDNFPREFPKFDVFDNLSLMLDIFILYEKLCPQLLDGILTHLDPVSFTNIQTDAPETGDKKANIIIKTTNLFLSLDETFCLPHQELFSLVIPLIFENYYQRKDESSKCTLVRLFQLTGIFEGSNAEIEVWVNSIFALKRYEESVSNYVLNTLKEASSKIMDLTNEFNEIKVSINDTNANFDGILEILSENLETTAVRNEEIHLSPLIIAFFHCETPLDKYMKTYLNSALINLLHIQHNPNLLVTIAIKYEDSLSNNVFNYVTSWQDEILPLDNFKSKLTALEVISKRILIGSLDNISEHDLNLYPDFRTNLIHMCIFYLTNLANLRKLNEQHMNSCLKIVNKLLLHTHLKQKHLNLILNNSILLQFFEIFQKSGNKHNHKALCTKFLIEIIKQYKSDECEFLLTNVRDRLHFSITKILNKIHKYKAEKFEDIINVLSVIELHHSHCREILNLLSTKKREDYLNDNRLLPIVTDIVVYALKRFHVLYKSNRNLDLLDENLIGFLSRYLTDLNSQNANTSAFANVFREYLQKFPHSLQHARYELFEGILQKKEYCKENSLLAKLLLKSSEKYLKLFSDNVQSISHMKGLMLPLLEASTEQNASNELLEKVYTHFEQSISKALQKPQKASNHFDSNYNGLLKLVEQFMPMEKCLPYVQKVHKYETTEVYHVHLLCTIFGKVLDGNVEEKHWNNAILTLVHLGIGLLKKKGKTDEDWRKTKLVTDAINNFLRTKIIASENKEVSYRQVVENETFQLYNKLCLKFGLSSHEYFLELLRGFCGFLNFDDDYAALLMDMIVTHSDFLEVVLSEETGKDGRRGKVEVLNLMLVLCQKWPKIMQKNHLALLLSAYNATWKQSDRIILCLLKLYEGAAGQTYFYDFKPFLWGKAAANYYSVRSDLHKALWRQPRMGNIVDILQERWISNTIKEYPLEAPLEPSDTGKAMPYIYDLTFMLPLFSYLLAPENSVQTYKFSRSGALSLTIAALSSEVEQVREAACFVLYRYYHHLDAKQGGKDKLIYLRLVDAVCKGTAVLKDCKMNNFASIFFAKMALILTQPLHVMYVPLTQYLSAKAIPNINCIPELLTLLHSSDVNYKEHRHFVLEIVRDGLRTDQDLKVALKCMAFKLIMELYNSSICDSESKVLILEIISKACLIKKGAKYLCNIHGVLSFLFHVISHLKPATEIRVISLTIRILCGIIKSSNEFFDCVVFSAILGKIMDNCDLIKADDVSTFTEIVYHFFLKHKAVLTKERLRKMVDLTKCADAEYLLSYGHYKNTNFDEFIVKNHSDNDYYIKLLIVKYFGVS